jgi:GNAT superfamily N-acetyltransferase
VPDITIVPASKADAENLARLRVDAMRPSLEAIGRFDPARALNRFLDTFCPQDTKIIHADGRVAGFYVVRRRPDHLYLDHLYLQPELQRMGIGRRILEMIKENARRLLQPVRLMALAESPANDFYRDAGFRFLAADTYDVHYEWRPEWDRPGRSAPGSEDRALQERRER